MLSPSRSAWSFRNCAASRGMSSRCFPEGRDDEGKGGRGDRTGRRGSHPPAPRFPGRGWSRQSRGCRSESPLFPPPAGSPASSRTRSSLDCRGRGMSPDLVEQHGPAVGPLELAGAPRRCPGESTALMSEQLAFDQRLGNGGAVDGDEGACLSRTVVVDQPGDELLAGPALSLNQHCDVAIRARRISP